MHIIKGIFLLLLAGGSYGATISNNGYEDVLISIHPDIPGDSVDSLITGIKKFVTEGSKLLFTATKKHLYIKSVKILLPNVKDNPKWNEVSQAKQTDETLKHEDAWIKIEEPTPLRYFRQDLNLPFTKGSEQCGKAGQHIHLTEDYLKKIDDNEYKPFRATEFVHNWATLRFGVFDEHGYQGDPDYPLFYWDPKTKKMKPNMCTNTAPKIRVARINENGKITPVARCEIDDKTNLCKKEFIYIEGESGTYGSFTGSLMVEPNTKVDSPLEVFSDDSNHNREAPTKHNDICGRKSVWSVIETMTADYQQVSGPMTTNPPAPTFEVLQPVAGCEDSKLVFVLDTSGSMSGDRIENLKSQATDYIKSSTFLHDGTKLGIVGFSSSATVIRSIESVTSSNRKNFVNDIQGLVASGGTGCEAGLDKGLDELNGVNDQTKGGTILFMTDGGCSSSYYFKSTSERASRNGVKVISFALGVSADPNMESLATETGGKFRVWTPSVSGSKTSFADLLSSGRKCVQSSGNFDVTMMRKTVANRKIFKQNFLIDKSIGRDVTLIVQNFGPAEITEIEVQNNEDGKELLKKQGVSLSSPFEEKTLHYF